MGQHALPTRTDDLLSLKALIETLWRFPKQQDGFPVDHSVEFFAECVFYGRENLGLCREADRDSRSNAGLQFDQLATLSELIFELTARRVSVFDIIESCVPVVPVRFPVVNVQLVFDWFLCEVVSGGGFSDSDERDYFSAVHNILGADALAIDLTDSSAVSVSTINRLDTATVAKGFFSYVLYDQHTLPFKIKLKDFLDRLHLAAFDTSYQHISD